ncbi:hypothetical protein T05_8145 [Trichinella murrelli]|uniref:Uncharacterized protein n=1 Tax=Trichinella murrelli TaxID=144512 RepID=A0A0V0T2V6_9BILA|nr:hypothetical protein T05_2138 [Trichinella murrelli]KRX33369.1 hypothetical protein T05_8349 [Trichinella murrelli]KRX37091.1 hypothetical protein T05_8145 [Trichinella murrelli]
MGFQSSYSIPEFIDLHSTPKSVSTPIRPLSLYRPLRESHRTPRGRYRPLWLPLKLFD